MVSCEFMLFPLQRSTVLPSGEINLFRTHLFSDSEKPSTGGLCPETVRNNINIFRLLESETGNCYQGTVSPLCVLT